MKTVFRSFVAELFEKAAHTDVDLWFDGSQIVVMVGRTARRFTVEHKTEWGPIEEGQMHLTDQRIDPKHLRDVTNRIYNGLPTAV